MSSVTRTTSGPQGVNDTCTEEALDAFELRSLGRLSRLLIASVTFTELSPIDAARSASPRETIPDRNAACWEGREPSRSSRRSAHAPPQTRKMSGGLGGRTGAGQGTQKFSRLPRRPGRDGSARTDGRHLALA